MVIVYPDKDGNAPQGCKKGTLVNTQNGAYQIVSWWRAVWFRKARYNPFNGYWSERVSIK